MLKQLSTFIIFLAFAFPAFSQIEKPNYSLLWEISGNGLPQSSFLFGTVHLRDERVFEFPDSLMLAIEQCSAFAMEVHPDSAISYVLDKSLNNMDTSELMQFLDRDNYEDVEQMINDELSGSLDSLLRKKKTNITERFLNGLKELPFSKKRPQILDLTLFGYAQDRGKNMYGLERMADYKDLGSAFVALTADTTHVSHDYFPLNRMIENYRKGEIDSMNIPIGNSLGAAKFREELLTNRNLKMVAEIIRLAQTQRIFCAVGSGHLPGDDGMLALLKAKGFQVRRVLPRFTGVADSLFEVNRPKLDIINFEDEMSGYSAKLPLQPLFQQIVQPFDSGEEDGPNSMKGRMFLSNDLRRGMQYMLMSLDYPPTLNYKDKNIVFDALQKGYEQSYGRMLGKPQDKKMDGISARRSSFRMPDNIIDIQVAMRANRVYMFAVLRPIGTSGGGDSLSDQFFKEVHLLPITHSTLKRAEMPKMGTAAAFPSKPFVQSKSFTAYNFPNENQVLYAAADTLSAHTYSVTETNWSKYYQSENPDSFLISYKQKLEEDPTVVVRDTAFKSMPAFIILEQDTANQYYNDHLILLHDEGIYELVVNKSSAGNEDKSWAFFNSFEPKKTWTGDFLKRQTKPLIFADLVSRDSATVAMAKLAFNRMPLTKEDLPAVFNILEREMVWDSSEYASVHATLLQKLPEVEDEEILLFLPNYFWINHKSSERQKAVLEALLSIGSKESYDTFFNLAGQADTSRQTYLYAINRQFNKDSSLVLEHIPAIMQLRRHPFFEDDIHIAIESCLKSQPSGKSLFGQYTADIVNDGTTILETTHLLSYKDTIPDSIDYSPLYSIIGILGQLPSTTASSDFLRQLVEFKPNRWIRADALIGLYNLGGKIDNSWLEAIHGDPYAWHYFLTNLDEKHITKIPKKLMDVETFIHGGIPSLMDDEIEQVNNFKILEKRKHIYEGKEVWLYVFSFEMDYEEGTAYLGICAQPKSSKLSIKPEIYSFSFEPFTGKNKEILITNIIKDWREYMND